MQWGAWRSLAGGVGTAKGPILTTPAKLVPPAGAGSDTGDGNGSGAAAASRIGEGGGGVAGLVRCLGPLLPARLGGWWLQVAFAAAHTLTHVSLAVWLVLLLELGVETCIR